jgi:adenylylsulfate kinase
MDMISSMAASYRSWPQSQAGLTVWFTGLSGAGKTTISQAVHQTLHSQGYKVELLDGDLIRQTLTKGLGFSQADREENIRRIGFVAHLLTRNGVIVLVSAISPYRAMRQQVRQQIGAFLEVYVNAPLATCEQRDIKGLYQRARAGEIPHFTGIDDPYEPPLAAEVICQTDQETIDQSVAKVMGAIATWQTPPPLPVALMSHANALAWGGLGI